uniref:Uncharacterized protein n=1 Tax=Aegilops tauschii subsp. strangulata TaxID=200361 RepID=A0A453RY42_AEGTS
MLALHSISLDAPSWTQVHQQTGAGANKRPELVADSLDIDNLEFLSAVFCSYSLTIYIGALAVTRRSCDVTPADIFICNFRYLSNAAPDLQTSCAVASAFLRFAPLLVRNGPERRRRRSSEMRRRNIRGNAH